MNEIDDTNARSVIKNVAPDNFHECLQGNPSVKSCVRVLLLIKPRKTIYHCKADKLKFAKISMFFFYGVG